MIKEKYPVEIIAKITKLSSIEIEELKKTI